MRDEAKAYSYGKPLPSLSPYHPLAARPCLFLIRCYSLVGSRGIGRVAPQLTRARRTCTPRERPTDRPTLAAGAQSSDGMPRYTPRNNFRRGTPMSSYHFSSLVELGEIEKNPRRRRTSNRTLSPIRSDRNK